MTKSPNYTWRCHRCDQANPPGTTHCAQCNFPAIATAGEIDPAPHPSGQSIFIEHSMLFFPEVLVAGSVILLSPVVALWWAVLGHFAAAVGLIGVTVAAVGVLQWTIRWRRVLPTYAAIFCYLVLVFAIYFELPK